MMLRRVLVGKAHEYLLVITADTPRLVDRQLLLDGDVHTEMQERIGLARFRKIIALARRLGMFEKRMIFRVPQNHLHDELFHALKRASLAVRAPGAEKYFARLSAILPREHTQKVLARSLPGIQDLKINPLSSATFARPCAAKQAEHGGILVEVIDAIERADLAITIHADDG